MIPYGTDHEDPPDWQIDPDGVPPALPTWGRIDLTAHANGRYQPPAPTLMPRADGKCLLYPGLVHSIHGESESGKSWIAQAETARLIKAGEPVLYLDFESDPGSVVGRLIELGTPRQAILDLLDYRHPEVRPTAPAEIMEWQAMLSSRYTLAVIDGVTDALGIWGAKSIDNDQVAEWMRVFPKPLAAATGAAVLMIDHVTKNAATQGRFAIGGQAKMAGLTGAAYTVDVREPLGRGLRGVLSIRVGKDRPGGVRGWALAARSKDRTQEVAWFILDATGRLTASLAAPPETGPQEFRPTVLMERVSLFLEVNAGASGNAIVKGVSGKTDAKHAAIKILAAEGYLKIETSKRGAQHFSLAPFRAVVDQGSPPLPNLSPGSPREDTSTSPTSPPPLTGGEVQGGDRSRIPLPR